MRSTRFAQLLLIPSVFVIAGCGADQSTSPPVDDLTSRVQALGFSVAGMQDYGSFIVVEGDIRLEKAILLQGLVDPVQGPASPGIEAPTTGNYQYSTTTTVSPTYVRQIRVNLNNINAVSDWASAARTAMAAYNASGSNVYMYEASPGDITFSSVASANYVASASFPYQGSPSGKPGPTVTVNRTYNYYTVNQKQWIMAHEFGHTIGLRHDDAADLEGDAGIGAHLVNGTVEEDASSVMQKWGAGTNWAGFSQYDVIAIRALYPVPFSVSVSGPFSIPRYQSSQYTATTVAGSSPITYQWRLRHQTTQYIWGAWSGWTSPSSQNYTYTSVNSCGINMADLEVMVTDAASQTATNNILISISNPC